MSDNDRELTYSEVAYLWLQQGEVFSKEQDRPVCKCSEAVFGEWKVSDIDSSAVRSYLHKLARKGFVQQAITEHLIVIRDVLEFAVKRGLLKSNPCADMVGPKPKKLFTCTPISLEEWKKVGGSADVWLFPCMTLFSGMKKGEILALTWADIHFDTESITVSKTVVHQKGKPVLRHFEGKQQKREVPLLLPLRQILLSRPPHEENDYVISENGKTPLSAVQFLAHTNRYRRRTGILCTAQELRYAFMALLFQSGLLPCEVQRIVGQKEPDRAEGMYADFCRRKIYYTEKARDYLPLPWKNMAVKKEKTVFFE